MGAATPRLDERLREPVHRTPLWLLLIPLQVCVGFGLAAGSVSALAVLAAAAAVVIALLLPRAALLAALAAVPPVQVSVKGIPIGEAMVAGAVLGLFVHFLANDHSLGLERPPAWLAFGFAFMFYLLLASTIFNDALDGEALRRFGHLAVGAMLAWLLAARVVEPELAAKAFLVGLLISGLAGFGTLVFGFAPFGDASYEDRLTGLFGDPNIAGFYVLVIGAASLGFIKSRRARVLLGGALLAILVATLSRTSLLAVALVVIWVIASGKGYVWVPVMAVVVCGFLAFGLAQQVKGTGPFQDRGRSDSFRRDVYRKTKESAATSPLLGQGAAPERLLVQGGRIFPHNSYLAAVIEGGVFWLLAWVAVLVTSLWKLTRARRRNLLLEAAIVALFVVGINLGEVLFELPAMALIGLAAAYLSQDARLGAQITPPSASRRAAQPALAGGSPASQ